ncbi:hypothetical protein CJ195_24445 [Bacillus sp. UMB0899]|uniref:hypothetical protein n=1 Tax=Metabacillus schmidteae TaxID=2730405 RepID=UPI000C7F93F5|nr:hypothetical protein [Metabacillus schmidteae]PMC34112.1 hypothetical protein CJ195_24445 [Bacillus sp. UMB0899]
MNYYLLHEKERIELECIVSYEIRKVNELIEKMDSSKSIKRRALQERKNVLMNIKKKIEFKVDHTN